MSLMVSWNKPANAEHSLSNVGKLSIFIASPIKLNIQYYTNSTVSYQMTAANI